MLNNNLINLNDKIVNKIDFRNNLVKSNKFS